MISTLHTFAYNFLMNRAVFFSHLVSSLTLVKNCQIEDILINKCSVWVSEGAEQAEDKSKKTKKGFEEFRMPLVLAQASPIFHSSCEGKLGIALE